MAGQYTVSHAIASHCRKRTAFLLERINQGPTRPLEDLLANAYAQGVEDAVIVLMEKGVDINAAVQPTAPSADS